MLSVALLLAVGDDPLAVLAAVGPLAWQFLPVVAGLAMMVGGLALLRSDARSSDG